MEALGVCGTAWCGEGVKHQVSGSEEAAMLLEGSPLNDDKSLIYRKPRTVMIMTDGQG